MMDARRQMMDIAQPMYDTICRATSSPWVTPVVLSWKWATQQIIVYWAVCM